MNDGASPGHLVFGVLGALVLVGTVFGIRFGLRKRDTPDRPTTDEPPGLAAKPSVEPQARFDGEMFPMTGHMPIDVRRALNGA